jgi:hypothetical protein
MTEIDDAMAAFVEALRSDGAIQSPCGGRGEDLRATIRQLRHLRTAEPWCT